MNCFTTRRPAQSLVELALLMPLLAMLLIGLIEIGFLLQAHVQVASAAREAARDASLYRANRFAFFTDSQLGNGSLNQLPKCESNIPGWSLQQMIEQAIVRRVPIASGGSAGCPNTSGTVLYSALGRLDATRAPTTTPLPTSAAGCPTGDLAGWVAGIHSSSPAFTQSSATPTPEAGSRATLTLCYPYRTMFVGGLLNFPAPIWIGKSVVFEYQQ